MSRKDSLRILFITVVGVTFFAFFKNHLVSSAQDSPAYYDLVRTIDTFGIGLLNPTGLVFSPSNNALFVLASGKTPDGEITGTSLAQVGLYREDLVNLFEIPVSIPELANLVYDGKTNSLLFFNPSIAELVQIHSRDAQVYVPSAEQFTHFDLRALGIKQFKGTAFDPATGNLYLLDSVGPRIIRIKPHPEKGYSGASAVADGRVRYLDLSNQEWGELRAIAYHPGDEHLYLLGGSRRAIYKLAQNGQVVSFYDLSDQNLIDPVDMVFAPSGDPTDDPTIMNLYLTDRGSTTPQRRRNNRGQIVEISFTKPIVADTSPFRLPTSLVNTIDTSSWSPPSPDPAGLSYRESTHTLIVSDSEVNETQFFQGKNLFESTLGGELLVSYNTLYFTEEPTGLALDQDNPHFYFSDDNRNQIYELDPGFDKEIRTPDDIVRVIDTETFGSFDPEGVAYGQGMLFIVDGVGEEVYKLFPGENGIFDGVPPQGDDSVSSFDTTVIGAGDPEGIDFNFLSGTLFILSRGDELLLETTLDGALINTIDLAFFDPINPGGVALAPGSQDPDVMNLYIADRGVDNDIDPNENDGKIYEITYRSESIFSIFQDDFESGDLSAWSAFAGSDDLRVTTSAALTGDYGLEIVIDSNSPRYLVDETPDNEAIYRSRFRFDPNSISMQDFERHYLFSGFSGADPVFYLEFRRIPGSYLVRVLLRDDSGAFSFSDWQTLSDQPHSFELIWQAASSPASDDGALSLDLDGAKIADLTGVDNASQRIDTVYLGPWSGIDSGTHGTYFLDEFESYRDVGSPYPFEVYLPVSFSATSK